MLSQCSTAQGRVLSLSSPHASVGGQRSLAALTPTLPAAWSRTERPVALHDDMIVPRISNLIKDSLAFRVIGFLFVVVFFATSSNYLTTDIRVATGGKPEESAFLAHFLAWFVWFALLVLFLLVRRVTLRRFSMPAAVRGLFEIALCVGYALVSVELTVQLLSEVCGAPKLPPGLSIQNVLPMMTVRAASMYALVLIALIALKGEARRRQSENAAKELLLQQETLERQLVAARLKALQSQLHPHFLFNALNAIGGLILTEERQRAHRALVSLSSLLRESLRSGDSATTTVEEELEIVTRYVELEYLRFGDRMNFSIDVDPDVLHASVPTLILLPIVENAVTHGLEPRSGGGRIEVKVSAQSDQLQFQVVDDGVGRAHASRNNGTSSGIGLTNTTERLQALYGDDASVQVEDEMPHGTRVSICLPLRIEAPQTESGLAT